VSEKPMTDLLRRAGIIDKHIAEFEKWRLIDPNSVEGANMKSAGGLVEDLVHDIAELLEAEPTMRQTLVAPVHVKEPPRLWCAGDEVSFTEAFYAVKDEMGRLLTSADATVVRGDLIWQEGSPKQAFTIVDIEELYENDKIVAKMITVEKE